MVFDHVTAWNELAKPGFDSLLTDHPKIRAILKRVVSECHDLKQISSTLLMPWPDIKDDAGETLRDDFNSVPSSTLALASYIVYNYGHWWSGLAENPLGGTTWKFSDYADQVLRERLGILHTSGRLTVTGYTWGVDRGLLTLRSTDVRGNFQTMPVAFATEAAKIIGSRLVGLAKMADPAPSMEEVATQITVEAAPQEGLPALCFQPGRWMVSEEEMAYRKECADAKRDGLPEPKRPRPKSNEGLTELYGRWLGERNSPFTINGVVHINHRLGGNLQALKGSGCPHPFTIGPQHLAKAVGMFVTGKEAPCAECGHDIKHHISDRVVLVRLLRNIPSTEAQPLLVEFAKEIEHDGLDGMIFVETPEKFRVTTDAPPAPKLSIAE